MAVNSTPPPRIFLVAVSVRGSVDPSEVLQIERLGPLTSLGIEPMIFRLVSWYLNQLQDRLPL
jgi:hypothetical protein